MCINADECRSGNNTTMPADAVDANAGRFFFVCVCVFGYLESLKNDACPAYV